MSFRSARAYDLERVFMNTDEFAETVEYRRVDHPIISLSAYCGNPEPIDAGEGVLAEVREVYLLVADMVNEFGDAIIPDPTGMIVRFPDDPALIEIWEIMSDGVNLDGTLWRIRAMKPIS